MSLPSWLPIIINSTLPKQWLFSFSSDTTQKNTRFNLNTKDGSGFLFSHREFGANEFYFHIKRSDGTYCSLLSFKGVNLKFTRKNLPTAVDEFILDIGCIAIIEETEPSLFTWSALNRYLPPFNIKAKKVSIIRDGIPLYQSLTSELVLDWVFANQQHFLRLSNPKVQLEANFFQQIGHEQRRQIRHHIVKQLIKTNPAAESKRKNTTAYELNITKFNVQLNEETHLTAKGQIVFDNIIARRPKIGQIDGILDAPALPEKANIIKLNLSDNKLSAMLARPNQEPLLYLPITIAETKISVAQGKWSWPYLPQKLQGNFFISVNSPKNDDEEAQLTGRINFQTEAQRGKSNLVLTIPQTKFSEILTKTPFQLTGGVNINNIALSMTVPGYFQLNEHTPEIKLLPGALVRAWGELINEVYIEEARFPLAGISITPNGLNGRLQAILKTREALWGQVDLHMDGKAINLLPKSGKWFWLSWGQGRMPLLNANWDMASKGQFKNGTLYVESLSTGLDQMRYGLVKIDKPRIALLSPIILRPAQLKLDNPALFKGQLRLDASTIKFNNGGQIDEPVFDVKILGTSVRDFQFKGDLQSERFKRIALNGRWDGQRIRGQGWWPSQSVSSFRNLFSEETDIDLQTGSFYAQASFSAAAEQGFVMGGHLVFNDVDLRYENSHIQGLDFIMPYYFADHRWQLGKNAPVTLRVNRLKNVIDYQDLQMDLQGFYPFDPNFPLSFSNMSTNLLGGNLSIDEIRFPQTQPAHLIAQQIDSEQFWQIINPKQFSMQGRFGGELELLFNDADWLIKNGRIYNQGDIRVLIEPNMVKEIKHSNIAAGAAIEWLSQLQISDLKMQLTLSNLGELLLTSRVKARNRALSDEKLIDLNYTHEENVLALWRSLTFKNDLHDWLESVFSNFERSLKAAESH